MAQNGVMENQGLLFIPDISGFTRFVNETEIEHSRLIIQELLEILLNANQIGLEVSEIEGDAILFYKFGPPPALGELYQQVAKMFCAFHSNLATYEYRRYCQCKACMSAIGLSLKVVTHFGEFTGYNVKQYHKLIGRDVIVAHQLLKNDIPQHEYWLVTQNLLGKETQERVPGRMHWQSSSRLTESGEVNFSYTPLSQLKENITPVRQVRPDLSKFTRVWHGIRDFDTDMITLFHAVGDFSYRNQWMEGVREVEHISHLLPRVGMKCRCILDNGETFTYSSSYHYHPNRIEFTETDERTRHLTHYILEKRTEENTRLTIDYYLPKNPVRLLKFHLSGKQSVDRRFSASLDKLDKLTRELHIPI